MNTYIAHVILQMRPAAFYSISSITRETLIEMMRHVRREPNSFPSIREQRLASPRRMSPPQEIAFFTELGEAVQALKSDPDAWQGELDERSAMNGSLKDGLDDI